MEDELLTTHTKAGRSQGKSRKKGQLDCLSNSPSSTLPQLQPVDPSGSNGQQEETQEDELTIQPQEEAEEATKRGEKRGVEDGGETGNDATVAKRFCSEQTSQSTSETCLPSSESADGVSEQETTEADEVIDVETVSLSDIREEQDEKKSAWTEIALREAEACALDEESESSEDEIIDVDGSDTDEQDKHAVSLPSRPEKERSVRSSGSWEDKIIDVTGGSSPVPAPEVITWTETSEGEEDDVDVVGEKMDYVSSTLFTAMIKGELLEKRLKTDIVL